MGTIKIFFKKIVSIGFFATFSLCLFLMSHVESVRASSTIPYILSGSYVGDGTGSHAITGLGFQPDAVMIKIKTATPGVTTDAQTVIRTGTMFHVGDNTVKMATPPISGTSIVADAINSLDEDGFTVGGDVTVNSDGVIYYWTAFKADQNLTTMSFGEYDGNAPSTQGVFVHFLPDFVMVINNSGATSPKVRSSTMSWAHSFYAGEAVNNNRITLLSDPNNFGDNNYGFTVGNSADTNASGSHYSFIAFKNTAGRVITGSYVGDNSSGRTISGLGFQPGLLWITPEGGGAGSDWKPSSLSGTDTFSFNVFSTVTNQILSLINDGFTIGNHARVNGGQTYHYVAWLQAIPPQITTSSLSDGEATVGYSQSLVATGGDGAYSLWVISSGNLPDGLSIDPDTGEISGTTNDSGVFNFGVTVVSADQPSAEKAFSLTIAAAPGVTTDSLPDAEVGLEYSQTLEVAGGSETYTNWVISSGNLPDGLGIDNDTGEISGTPTTAGVSNFSVIVTDDNGGFSDAADLSITVLPPPSITTLFLPNKAVGTVYSENLTATGGSGTYSTWTLSSGSLPSGLGLSNEIGLISGLLTVAGPFNFSITVTDSNGITSDPTDFLITIAPPDTTGGSAGGGGSGGYGHLIMPFNSVIRPASDQSKSSIDQKTPEPPFFLDTPGTWAEKEIDSLKSDCNVLGYRDAEGNLLHLFGPNNTITRGELITMIVRCKYGEQVKPSVSPFPKDLPLDHWATPYVSKAKKEGIVIGFPDGSFGVDQNATTAEALKMIVLSWVKAKDIELTPKTDVCSAEVGSKDWFEKYYNFAFHAAITDGFPDGKGGVGKLCSPAKMIDRASVATLITRLIHFLK